MLTPDYLDALPQPLVALMEQVEEDILQDVARRIGNLGLYDPLTEGAEWQLWRHEQTRALRSEVVKRLAKASGKTEAQVRKLLQQAGLDTLASDDDAYRAMGFDPPGISTSPALLNLLNAGYRQTMGSWRNLTATTANTVTKQFEDALDRAWLQVSSGAFDYKTAVKRAVDDLAQHMKFIEYPSGHRDTLEVAVRRAVLTGVNQTAGKLQLERMDQMAEQGFGNFVEVSAHTGARSDGSGGAADHAAWQGKVYHRGGRIYHQGEWYEDFVQATGYGTGEGLCGWNCRHNFHPFWPGISKRNYTNEQLAAMNEANVPYNGKLYTRYEINQMQRALERKVRSAKRKYLAESAAGVDASRSAVRLKAARQQLNNFIRATGGRADSSRTSVAGFGRSAASKATWAAKKAKSADYFSDSPRFLYDDMLRYLDHEELLVYTADGKLLFKKFGNASRVALSKEEAKLLQGAYTSHNHPSGGPPSPADIYMLYKHRIASVHVSTRTHGIFVIDQPSTWKKVPSSVEEMDNELFDFADRYRKQILRRIESNSITLEEGEYLIQRLALRRLCRKYGVRMELREWNDPLTSKITE